MVSWNINNIGTHIKAAISQTRRLDAPASAYTAEGRLKMPEPAIEPNANATAARRLRPAVRVDAIPLVH